MNPDSSARKASALSARLSAAALAEAPDVGVAGQLQREVHAFAARYRTPVPVALSALADAVLQRAQDYQRDPADLASLTLELGRVEGALRVAVAVTAACVEMG